MALDLNNVEELAPTKSRRKHWLILGAMVLTLILIAVAGLMYISSDGFRERMRQNAVAMLQQSTGGRAELKSLDWSLTHLTVALTDLTIHGRESEKDAPFVHVGNVMAKIKIISLFSRDFSLKQVQIDQPVIHIIVYPDGTTNQPQPKLSVETGDPVQKMFQLAMEHAEVTKGVILFNEQKIPIELKAEDVIARLSFDASQKSFDGRLATSKIEVKSPTIKTITGSTDASFSLYSDHAQIHSLKLASRRSQLDAVGTISSFQPFKGQFEYKGTVDVAEFASTMVVPQLRAGRADVSGSTMIVAGQTTVRGKLVLHDAEYQDPNVRLRGVNGGAEYLYSSETARLSLLHIFLHGLGGNAIGSGQIDSFLGKPAVGAKTEQKGSGTFQVTDISAHDLAIAVSSRILPLDKLRTAGKISGNVGISWNGSPNNAFANLDIIAEPPSSLQPRELPITGFLQGIYDASAGSIAIQASSLSTPASRIVASGTLGSRTANLKVSAQTSNLAEVNPLITAAHGPEPLPFELGGNAKFDGTLSGKLRMPTIAGHLDASNFTTHLAKRLEKPLSAPASTQYAYPRFVHWDSLSADFTYGPDKVTVSRAQLRRQIAIVAVSGNSTLTGGLITEASRFQAHVQVQGADVAELQSIAGLNYPVTGHVDLAFDVSGTRSDLSGGGNLTVIDGAAYGQPVKKLTSVINFSADQVQFRNASLTSDIGAVNGGVTYNLNSRAFTLEVHGKDFHVERFAFANRQNFKATGQITFDASGSGTLEAPVINANARLHAFTINRQPLGDLSIDAVTHGAELQLSSRSSMQHAAVVLNGSIHLRGEMPGHAVLLINSNNLNPLIAAFVPIRISGPTTLDSRVEINGPFRDPRNLSVSVTVDKLASELEGIGVFNSGPIVLRITNQTMTIDRLRLAGEGNRFLQVRGTAELGGQQRLDMQADGDINLKLLQSANSNLIASGYSAFGVTVGGTLTKPLINGQLQFHDGAVGFLDLPNGLTEINGTVYFNQDRAQIRNVSARTGGGVLDLAGFVSYDRGVSFNLTANGREIRIRYPDGVSSTATAALQLSGNLKNSVLSGDVTVTRFGLNPRFDFAYYLARSKEPQGAPKIASPLNNVRLDIHVVSTPELQVQTSLAKISSNVDLHVRGTGTHPVLLGHINIVEGKVDFNGTTYTLERGDITFANPVTIDPILDIEASAHVRDYDITLGFHGSPLQNKLTSTYRSDPPLPPGDIIALLALGRTREEATNASTAPGSQQQTFSDTTSSALLGQAINATISNRVSKIFGVSRIKIDPQVAGVENSGYARVTVDQQISNKITLTYITNVSQSAQQIIQFEYNVNRNVSIVAVRDQNGVFSFDVRLRQRKR
jgi:translocation and assembly module TamB